MRRVPLGIKNWSHNSETEKDRSSILFKNTKHYSREPPRSEIQGDSLESQYFSNHHLNIGRSQQLTLVTGTWTSPSLNRWSRSTACSKRKKRSADWMPGMVTTHFFQNSKKKKRTSLRRTQWRESQRPPTAVFFTNAAPRKTHDAVQHVTAILCQPAGVCSNGNNSSAARWQQLRKGEKT